MRKKILAILCLIAFSSAAIAQAPQAATPDKATGKPPKVPAMVLRAQRTKTARQPPDTYRGRILTVGSGGGVRGQETAYYLLDDGRLFSRKTGQTAYAVLGKQTPANTRRVFRSVENQCAIKKTTYDKPGNIYRFMGWKRGAAAHRVTWAPGSNDVPAHYEQVYKGFMGMIPVVN